MTKLFPVIATGVVDTTCSRRAMIQGLGAAAAAALAGGTLIGCGQPGSDLPTAKTTACAAGMQCIALTDPANAALTMVNGAMLIDSSTDTIMVIRTSQVDVIALSAICTHKQCSMNFDAGAQNLTCPCHGSVFGEDGSVINGPARKALKVYTATLATDQITVAT